MSDLAKLFPNASASFFAANRPGVPQAADPVTPAPKRLRQSPKPILNKLESWFLLELLKTYNEKEVFVQAVRLELARGHWYKPDFFLPAILPHDGVDEVRPAIAYEVKGPHAFRGGFENLKVAARVHHWIRFYLVWRDKELRWQYQTVLP